MTSRKSEILRAVHVCLIAVTFPCQPSAAEARQALEGINDVVGIAKSDNRCAVVLATTMASSAGWRLKWLAFERPVRRFELSLSGTKAMVEFDPTGQLEARPLIIDLLAASFREWSRDGFQKYECAPRMLDRVQALNQTLGNFDRFVSVARGRVTVLDDELVGLATAREQFSVETDSNWIMGVSHDDLKTVGIDSEGRILAGALHSLPSDYRLVGSLFPEGVASVQGAATDYAPRSLALTQAKPNLQAWIIPGRRDARHPNVIVTSVPEIGWAVTIVRRKAWSNEPEAEDVPVTWTRRFNSRAAALLAAGFLAASPRIAGADPGIERSAQLNKLDSTLETYLDRLLSVTEDLTVRWLFVPVVADVRLYAPIMLPSVDETIHPTAVGIWDKLAPNDNQSYRDRSGWNHFREQYEQAGAISWGCMVYHKSSGVHGIKSYEGSWLIEYWFYFPFDLSGIGTHLHDPEHLFVEVEKIGGKVRQVIGAAHGRTTSNNSFLTNDESRIRLPLRVLIERGKHATAIDVNHDGLFTAGIDENQAGERAHVWGIRDVTGGIDDALHSYETGMMLRRVLNNALVLDATVNVWRSSDGDAFRIGYGSPQPTCILREFPESSPGERRHGRDMVTRNAAVVSLEMHEDSQRAEAILKQWSFPLNLYRAGVSYGLGNKAQYSFDLALATQRWIHALIRKDIALPGRVALGVTGRFDRAMPAARIHYERFTTNLFGFYAGFHFNDGLWYSAGPMFEFPDFFWPKHNFNLHFGFAFKDGTAPRIDIQAQIGIQTIRKRSFGVRD